MKVSGLGRAVCPLRVCNLLLCWVGAEGKRQLHAAKARVRVLEKESNRGKANVKELLSKTETDNKLIDALRKKVAALQVWQDAQWCR